MSMIRIDAEVLHKTLRELNAQGGFLLSVLTDGDGLPISVAAASGDDPGEALAAMASLLQRQAQHSNTHIGLSEAEEVVITTLDDTRLVCRFFEANHTPMILACLIPYKRPYRRVMNRAIKVIKRAWSGKRPNR